MSLTKVKSKLSSRFKNTANGNDESNCNESQEDQLLAMKYDDFEKQVDNNPNQEMRTSKSFTSLNNIVEVEESEQNQDDVKLLPPVTLDPNTQPLSPSSTSINQMSFSNSSPVKTSSLQEKEFSFLQQQQNSSNPTSPINSNMLRNRHDSIIDPLNTGLINEKLNSQILSPQPSSISTATISSLNNTRRKSSNISNASLVQQPITPTNEVSINQFQLQQENLEFADAMALSILDKVDENIKIEQENQNCSNIDEWTIWYIISTLHSLLTELDFGGFAFNSFAIKTIFALLFFPHTLAYFAYIYNKYNEIHDLNTICTTPI